MDTDGMRKKLRWTVEYKNAILEKLYNLAPLDPDAVIDEYLEYADRLRPHVVDSSVRIY